MVAKFWIPANRGPTNLAEENGKIDMHDFPVHACTQEQNGSKPILRLAFHWSTNQVAVSVKKDCWDPEILLPW